MKTNVRVGVILCYCGEEIRGAVNIAGLESHARSLPGVVVVKGDSYPCSRPGAAAMGRLIEENELDRVVVAGCTPRLHGKLLAGICEGAGLARWFLDVANIREHCTRVHRDKGEATEKAKALIAASVAKVSLAGEAETIKATPVNTVLVVGGGFSGLSVAAELAGGGHKVTLVEKKDTLGGVLLELGTVYPYGKSGKEIVTEKISRIEGKVDVLTGATVAGAKGRPGEYRVTLALNGKEEERVFGSVVIATGADCIRTKEMLESLLRREGGAIPGEGGAVPGEVVRHAERGEALAGVSVFTGRVATQMDLERAPVSRSIQGANSVCFVNGLLPATAHAGASLYSLVALKNAAAVKEAKPDLEVWFVFKDIPSSLERYFRRARDVDVKFVRYSRDEDVQFERDAVIVRRILPGGRAGPLAGDAVSPAKETIPSAGEAAPSAGAATPLRIKAGLLVLPSLLKPSDEAQRVGELFHVTRDAGGFFTELRIKLRPGDFAERGVFVAGNCHSPASVLDCSAQAMSAACRVSRFLGEEISREPFVSTIDERICRGCSRCAEACEWKAIEMLELESGLKLAKVDGTLCTGCGVCSTVCICGAPSLAPVAQRQLKAMLAPLVG
ncbi:MAG: FAD-dependent oxidoreductase [Candidatus Eisenbacteria bacterium]